MDWGIHTDGAWRRGGRGEVDIGGDLGGGSSFVGCCEWHFAIVQV